MSAASAKPEPKRLHSVGEVLLAADCSDAELNRDRTVEVWLPGLLVKPKIEDAPPRPVK